MTRSLTTGRETGSRHVRRPHVLSYSRGNAPTIVPERLQRDEVDSMTVDHLTDAPHNSTTSRFADSRQTQRRSPGDWGTPPGIRTRHPMGLVEARPAIGAPGPPASLCPNMPGTSTAMWAHSHATYTPMSLDLCRHASAPAHRARGRVVDSL